VKGDSYYAMKTLVIGLGNPILGDDGVGWKVIEAINNHQSLLSNNVETDCLSVGGLSLMERLLGYEYAILVDAVQTQQNPIGTVRHFRLEELSPGINNHTASAHDTNLLSALQLGNSLGAALPKNISIVGIEAEKVYDFTEELTPPVAAAIPRAVQLVLELLEAKNDLA
jgi:hydrogenase maturation protease